MNIAGSLNYDTKIDTSGLESGLNKSKKEASGWADTFKIAIGNIIANMSSLVTDGLTQIARAGITYNAQIEKYQTALTTLTGSAEEANKIIEQIKKDASQTPFDVQGLVQANQLLISAGVSSEQARDDILALGNAISATGGGNDELSRMAVNLQQIKNVGKASALDIKQFAYAGIDLYGLLADSMGVTREEASNLEVTYEDLTEALKVASQEGGKYANAMENQSKTFNGQISNLQDNLNQFIGDAMKPLFDLIKDDILPIVNELIQGTGNVDELLSNLTDNILNFIGNTINKLLDMLPQFLDIGIDIILKIIEGISKQLPSLLTKIIDVVVKLIDKIIEKFPDIVSTGMDIIASLIDGLSKATSNLLEKAPQIITDFCDSLTNPNADNKLKSSGIKLIKSIISGMLQIIPELLSLPKRIVEQFFNRFKESIKGVNWGEFGKWIVDGIWTGIKNNTSKFYDNVRNFFKNLVKKAKETLGISSPSKVLAQEVGQWIPKGVSVGIEANTESVDKAIDELNQSIIDKMIQAVNVETGKSMYSGTNGTISQMMSAFGTTTVVNENKLYLDGDEIYKNQQTVSAKKNLQTQFGGGYNVSS